MAGVPGRHRRDWQLRRRIGPPRHRGWHPGRRGGPLGPAGPPPPGQIRSPDAVRIRLWPGLLRFQAARSYSLIRPLRTGFRRICHVPGFAAVTRGAGPGSGDALADALVGPGGVVVLLVVGQDSAQVRLVHDQRPVEKLPAQGARQVLADGIHPRRLHGGAHDRGAGGLEDGVEVRGEVRAAVTDEEPEVLAELVAEVEGEVAGLRRTVQSPAG